MSEDVRAEVAVEQTLTLEDLLEEHAPRESSPEGKRAETVRLLIAECNDPKDIEKKVDHIWRSASKFAQDQGEVAERSIQSCYMGSPDYKEADKRAREVLKLPFQERIYDQQDQQKLEKERKRQLADMAEGKQKRVAELQMAQSLVASTYHQLDDLHDFQAILKQIKKGAEIDRRPLKLPGGFFSLPGKVAPEIQALTPEEIKKVAETRVRFHRQVLAALGQKALEAKALIAVPLLLAADTIENSEIAAQLGNILKNAETNAEKNTWLKAIGSVVKIKRKGGVLLFPENFREPFVYVSKMTTRWEDSGQVVGPLRLDDHQVERYPTFLSSMTAEKLVLTMLQEAFPAQESK
ncbi:hypothetical protein ISS42_00055 [Candidatus Shapirobacteria bacterium]|nr:hypothetical protein [Candidatus Shapirobacteria bacterium]